MQDLQWGFTLLDKMSGNSDRMANSLERLEKSLGKTKKGSDTLQNSFGGFGGPVGTVVGGLKAVASVAIDVAEALLDIGANFGLALLKGIAFKESTIISFKAMMGSQGEAENQFKRSVLFANFTPLGTKDVVNSMKQIMGAGFKKDEAEVVFSALSDVVAMNGGGAQAMEGILRQISQAKSLGKFQQQDLNSISQWSAGSGFSMDAMLENLSKKHGVSKAETKDMMSSGAIGADEGIFAFLETVRDKVSGGKLGTPSIQQGTSIAGLMSTIESFPEQLMGGINLNSAGIGAVRGFLDNLTNLFNRLTGDGGKFQRVIQMVVDDLGGLFEGLSGEGGMAKLEGLFNGIADAAMWVWNTAKVAFEEFWLALKPFIDDVMPTLKREFGELGGSGGLAEVFTFLVVEAGHALGFLLEMILLPVRLKNAFSDFHDWAVTTFQELASAIINGLVEGLKTYGPLVFDTLKGLGGGMVEVMKTMLGVHSPSVVFEDIGRNTALGMQQGLEAGQAGINSALGEIAQPRATAMVGSRGGGAPISLTVEVNVDAKGEDAEAIARKLEDLLPGQLQTLFDRLAIETGVR